MKKRITIISFCVVIIIFLSISVVFLQPHSFIDLNEPIKSITVGIADMGKGEIAYTSFEYSELDIEFNDIIDCLSKYSYHFSIGTLGAIFSASSSMEGNDAGYWVNIYLDTDSERYTILCGGTGEIMVDDIVYRVGYWGNNKAISMMEEIRSIINS